MEEEKLFEGPGTHLIIPMTPFPINNPKCHGDLFGGTCICIYPRISIPRYYFYTIKEDGHICDIFPSAKVIKVDKENKIITIRTPDYEELEKENEKLHEELGKYYDVPMEDFLNDKIKELEKREAFARSQMMKFQKKLFIAKDALEEMWRCAQGGGDRVTFDGKFVKDVLDRLNTPSEEKSND